MVGFPLCCPFKSKPFLVTPMRQTRILAMLGFFLGWTLLIVGRLVWVQLIQHSEWAERAERQQERTFTVAPRRGILYDRNLHELAMTVVAQSIYAVPSEIGDQSARRCSDAGEDRPHRSGRPFHVREADPGAVDGFTQLRMGGAQGVSGR